MMYCFHNLTPRYGHTVIAWGDAIYLFGGRNDEAACNVLYRSFAVPNIIQGVFLVWKPILNKCDSLNSEKLFCRFDTNTFTWSRPKVFGDIPGERDGHSACVIGNFISYSQSTKKSSTPGAFDFNFHFQTTTCMYLGATRRLLRGFLITKYISQFHTKSQ